MNLSTPVIVRLASNKALGDGIIVAAESYMDVVRDDKGVIQRDENEQPVLERRRDCLVVWEHDRSQIYTHRLDELIPVEVVAVRTLDEMKAEVIDEVLDSLESEDDASDGEPEPADDAHPES